MTATLCFVAERVHAALGAQMRVGAGLEVVIVTAWGTRCIKVARWAWCIVAWCAVVELTRCALALTLWSIAIARWSLFATACRTVTKLGTITIACRAIAHTVTAYMATWAWCAAFRGTTLTATTATTIATTASGFGVANALHHFTACSFGCSSHHVTAWRLA